MATTSTLISLEEYLHTGYRPDRHYVDGVVEIRRRGEEDPTRASEEIELGEYLHNRLQGMLVAWFMSFEADWPIVAVVEQRMQVTPTRVRVCDVVLLPAGRRQDPVTQAAPVLCIEILSPEDRLPRVTRVLEDYRQWGVAESWLIHPVQQIAYRYTAAGLVQQQDPSILQLPNSPIYVDLARLFARLS